MQAPEEELILSYLANTGLSLHIRNRFKTKFDQLNRNFMPTISQNLINQVIRGNHYVVRSHPGLASLHLAFMPAIIVTVYGQISLHQRTYTKGQVCECQHDQQVEEVGEGYWAIEVDYLKPSTLVVMNWEIFNHRIEKIAEQLFKENLLQKLMPTKKLQITKSMLSELASSLTLHPLQPKYSLLGKNSPGLYLLIDGIFEVMQESSAILEIVKGFIEIKEGQEYYLRLKSQQGEYGIIPRDRLRDILGERDQDSTPSADRGKGSSNRVETKGKVSAERRKEEGEAEKKRELEMTRMGLEKIWKERQKVKQNYVIKKQYLVSRKKARQKFKQALPRNEKTSKAGVARTTINFSHANPEEEERLRKSRSLMLTKCATPMATSRSLFTPKLRKTSSSAWSSKKEKMVQNYNEEAVFERKYERTLSDSKEKMRRLKEYEELKRKNEKGSTEVFWLGKEELLKSSSMTYAQIKKAYCPEEAERMMTFKRIQKINSEHLIKRPFFFR